MGVTAGVPPRVEAGTKAALLDLVDGAVDEGWTTARACSVLELDSRRCRRWQHRRGAGRLDDHTAGGTSSGRSAGCMPARSPSEAAENRRRSNAWTMRSEIALPRSRIGQIAFHGACLPRR